MLICLILITIKIRKLPNLYFVTSDSLGIKNIGGSRGRAQRTPPRVQILLFRHTKFMKCNRLGSQRPPHYEVHVPPREILDPPLKNVQ